MAEQSRFYCSANTGELRASIRVISEADGTRHHVVATARHAEPTEFGIIMCNSTFRNFMPLSR